MNDSKIIFLFDTSLPCLTTKLNVPEPVEGEVISNLMLSLTSWIGAPWPYDLLLSNWSTNGLNPSSVILLNLTLNPSSINLDLSVALTTFLVTGFINSLVSSKISSKVKPDSLPVFVNCLLK